jgi:hypothetical protein
MTINRSNIKLQVTRGNKMKNLKSKKASDMQAEPSKTASELQAIPKGSKGKGLSKLPKPVRNKMGFKKQGGKVMKRKGGGMAYQLYGGKVSNNGNQFVQSFYDKGGK